MKIGEKVASDHQSVTVWLKEIRKDRKKEKEWTE